jgi:hypothetical protein
MSRYDDEVAMHSRVGNNYRNWIHTAQTLFAGSTILTREHARVRAKLRRTGKAPIELLTIWTELMLAAFGIECLVKAIWLKHGHQLARDGKYIPIVQKEGHRLVRLCRAVGINMDTREQEALERISIIGRTIGRYPIALSAYETQERQFHKHTGSPLSWSSDDDRIIESFVTRLKLMLRG